MDFSFGDRPTKKLSLRGKSKQDQDRDQIIAQARKQRAEAKLLKLQNNAAKRIQRVYKTYRTRKFVKSQQRKQFDEIVATSKFNVKTLQTLVKQFVYFYNKRVDVDKAIILAKLILLNEKSKDERYFDKLTFDDKFYQLRKILNVAQNIVDDLVSVGNINEVTKNTNILILCRLLMSYLESSPYKTHDMFEKMVVYVVQNGLFRMIRKILLLLWHPSKPKMEGPLFLMILSIIKRVLACEASCIAVEFAIQILSIPLIETKLKHLLDKKIVEKLINALNTWKEDTLPKPITVYIHHKPLSAKVCLLGNIISLMDTHMKSMDSSVMLSYMKIVNNFLKDVSLKDLIETHKDKDDMDIEENAPQELRNQFQLLLSRTHIYNMISAIGKDSNQFNLLAQFCVLYNGFLETIADTYQTQLSTLAYTNGFVQLVWKNLNAQYAKWAYNIYEPFISMISLFAQCYRHILIVMDDEEFFSEKNPFNKKEIEDISRKLKDVAFLIYWENLYPETKIRDNITKLVKMIHDRDSRKRFLPNGHWLISDVSKLDFSFLRGSDMAPQEEQQQEEDTHEYVSLSTQRMMSLQTSMQQHQSKSKSSFLTDKEKKIRNILRNIPFVIPFETRVSIFYQFIEQDQANLTPQFIPPITIRKNYIFDDAFNKLSRLNLKQDIRIQYASELGHIEPGIGRGVFKDFLTELCKQVFSGSTYGLFKFTNENTIYPNPAAKLISDIYLDQFEFLGKIMGKAIYEKILVDIPFARFFLSKLLGKTNFLYDLPSLDRELYKHLTFLKNYEGNVEDLSLNFTVVDSDFGKNTITELIPGGSKIPVTNENKLSYVYRVAHYRLNTQIKDQSNAFRKGLHQLIPVGWLSMFDENELYYIICGSENSIDINDWMKNCTYQGGYHENHPTIKLFWQVVSQFNSKQKKALLKFITSSPRPPLLGFKDFHPPICIHLTSDKRTDRLPTASTCMNLLKLPPYTSGKLLKEKLLLAIEQGNTGFELT